MTTDDTEHPELAKWNPPNFPLPAKIVTQMLRPVDVVPEFGKDPDIDEVDTHVRSVMQGALNWMARKRLFPILG